MAHRALIVFDVDGTLLETERVTVPAVQRTFAAYGLPVPDADTICDFFGRPAEDYETWLAEQCPFERTREIVAATNRLELALIGAEGRLYPGAREALEALHKQHALAVCSNGPEVYVNEFLDAHRVRPFFDTIRMRGARRDGKPVMIREIMDLIPARPAIVVGDRHDDVAAAHENGALAVAAAYGFGAPEELRDADATVTAAAQIPAAIQQLLETHR